MNPNVMKLHFTIPVIAGSSYVDISQAISAVNKKFVRQGLNWVVSNVEIITDGTAIVAVCKLPDSWVLANAWMKSFKLWQESQDQVLDIDGRGILGTYADFKIFYDANHESVGVASNLMPVGYDTIVAGASYDWDPTEYQVPNDPVPGSTTGYNLHALGPSTINSKGMISGYAASRARPQQRDPNVVDVVTAEDWMRDLFDVGDNLEEIREDIEDDNVSPPYLVGTPGSQLEYYPGGMLQANSYISFIHDYLVTRKTTSLAMDSTGSFLAPCGLLRLVVDLPDLEATPTGISMFIEVAPGPIKGLLAQPMQEMN